MYIFIPYLGIPLSRLLTDQLFALHSWPVNNDIYNIIQHLLNLLWLNDWRLNIPAIEKRRITRHNHFKVQWSRYWDKSMGWERGGFHMGTISLTSGREKSDIMMWHECMTQFNMAWNDTTRHDMTWHDMTGHDATSHHVIWHMTWYKRHNVAWRHNMVRHDMTQCITTWNDMTQHEAKSLHNMPRYELTSQEDNSTRSQVNNICQGGYNLN